MDISTYGTEMIEHRIAGADPRMHLAAVLLVRSEIAPQADAPEFAKDG